jgi:Zn finger protein HypA/HybF involved in hydrogenase expression
MANVDFTNQDAAVELVTLDPTRTRCTCRKSVLLPAIPTIHCPKCHDTYTSRTLGYPAVCAHCGFRLRAWRKRNNIPEIDVPLP